MKTYIAFFCSLAIGVWTLTGCEQISEPETTPVDRLPQNKAGEIVRQAIDFGGGWENWQQLETVQYKKTNIRYNEDGSVMRQTVQHHKYVLQPSLRVRIDYEDEDGRQIALINNGYYGWKVIDGQVAATAQDSNQARNPSFGSHYVFCMPFKLTDPGANLSFGGEEELSNGKIANKVRAPYEKGAGDSGGLHDWTYYFDKENGQLLANHIAFDNNTGHSFTEYLDYKRVAGIYMPTRRYGYRSNVAGEKVSGKISEYTYEDIHFNVPLPDSLFASPGK